MFGWLIAAAARASRRKLSSSCGSSPSVLFITLIATKRPSDWSIARYTAPIPPVPSCSSNMNWPSSAGTDSFVWHFGHCSDANSGRRATLITSPQLPQAISSTRLTWMSM